MADEDPLFDPLRRELQKQLLRYVVGRTMFCPVAVACKGNILDVQDAVLMEHATLAPSVACSACFEEMGRRTGESLGIEDFDFAKHLTDNGVEITDGRQLYRKETRHRG